MAGSRVLPIALVTISGVAIAVSTFDGEFKEQRRQRLENEFQKDVAAVSALSSTGPSPMASSTIPSPTPGALEEKKEEVKASAVSTSSWTSALGLWAWKKKDSPKEAAPAQGKDENANNGP
ncbi:hypothetical protein IQ07DRAFT_510739 [Pyrenochaeta sp. DS3sAY3a]|nr:hypothetical protein IQ07DRAFT_510739 [Pyrenochaeta sp. DS3sAY3a]